MKEFEEDRVIGGPHKGRPASGLAQETIAPSEEIYRKSLERAGGGGVSTVVVSFFLGRERFAFEVIDAIEVLKPKKSTEVPFAPGHIKGIFSLRGEMLPLVDLKKRLGIDEEAADSGKMRILVAGSEDMRAGFLVDKIGSVSEVPSSSIEPPGLDKEGSARFSKGTVDAGGARASILDTARLLDGAIA